jgi:hypothetical protein
LSFSWLLSLKGLLFDDFIYKGLIIVKIDGKEVKSGIEISGIDREEGSSYLLL